MPGKSVLSELEGASLAVIERLAPCTAYAVKEVFRASSSSYWSGSAGAIYPLVQRLHQAGTLRAETPEGGRRKSTLYSLTAQGRGALDLWLRDAGAAVMLGFDPLRTRLAFPELYSREALDRFLAEARRLMLEQPAPSPQPGNARIDRIHAVWLATRLEALEKISAILREV